MTLAFNFLWGLCWGSEELTGSASAFFLNKLEEQQQKYFLNMMADIQKFLEIYWFKTHHKMLMLGFFTLPLWVSFLEGVFCAAARNRRLVSPKADAPCFSLLMFFLSAETRQTSFIWPFLMNTVKACSALLFYIRWDYVPETCDSVTMCHHWALPVPPRSRIPSSFEQEKSWCPSRQIKSCWRRHLTWKRVQWCFNYFNEISNPKLCNFWKLNWKLKLVNGYIQIKTVWKWSFPLQISDQYDFIITTTISARHSCCYGRRKHTLFPGGGRNKCNSWGNSSFFLNNKRTRTQTELPRGPFCWATRFQTTTIISRSTCMATSCGATA